MNPKSILASFISGVLFALGLGVSGMMNPVKVQNFLDVTGNFDPSLLLVMGGALIASMVGYRLIKGKNSPWFDTQFHIPTRNDIDLALLAGPALFGIGWGMAGLCPGPAFANFFLLGLKLFYFIIPMFMGWMLVSFFSGRAKAAENCA